MSYHWLFTFLCITILVLDLSYTPVMSMSSNKMHRPSDEHDDPQHVKHRLINLFKDILNQPNQQQQKILLNQLREYLNRMCVEGYFGSSRAQACRRIIDAMQHLSTMEENNLTTSDENAVDESHGIQKRFFCNGFIGCKSSG